MSFGSRSPSTMAVLLPSLDLVLPISLLAVLWVLLHRYLQRHHLGPKTWPVLGCIVEQARNFDLLHDWLLLYFRRILTFSVPMVRINNTFTCDPANVEHILKGNFRNYPKGELIHERFREVLGDGIFNVDGEKWVRQRKVAMLEFSSAKLRDFSTNVFRAKALQLVEVLAVFAQKHQDVDLQDLFMRLTLDSICKVGFGVGLGSLSPELPAVPFARAFDDANALIIRRYVDFLWKVKRALNVGAEARLRQRVEAMDSFIYDVINTRRKELKTFRANGEEKVDLLSRFMTLENEEGVPYSDKQLRDVVINFIIAGRDTTALTLSWFFCMLCKHPEVTNKILGEVSIVLEDNQVNSVKPVPSDGYILNRDTCLGVCAAGSKYYEFAQRLNYQTLNRLHYLHAAITETLRLFPAVPLESKIALTDDTFPDGTKVKSGNFVSYVPYSMGRLEALWGPDANEFKPERWLKDGVFQPQSPYKLTAFQAGPRMCLGKDSAYLQMKMTTVLLLRYFSFRLVESHPPAYSMMVVLYIANGLKSVVSFR